MLGERKNLTILFADIVDSTSHVGRLDPEEAAALLARGVLEMEAAVRNYGGTVHRRLGDGIMAVFGAPVSVEDHAERAGHAALEMMRAVQQQQFGDGGSGISLNLRVGVNSGDVAVVITGDSPSDHEFHGLPVHLASRLQTSCTPGTICIGETTYFALHKTFECSFLGRRKVKGVEEPIHAYSLERVKRRRARFGLEYLGIAVPFVGRTEELRALTHRLHRLANQGDGCLVVLWGDAGIGKSRLLAEARATADPRIEWLEAPGVSFGESISYLPLTQMMRAWVGTDSDESKLRQRLSFAVEGLFGAEAPEVLPYLLTFVGLEVGPEHTDRVKYLDGDAMGRQIRRSVRLFLEKLARRRPTVVVLEDASWFDQSSAALVEHLVPLVDREALMICIVGRGEADSPDARARRRYAAGELSNFMEVHLEPLATDDSAEFVEELLDEGLAELRDAITAKAEGNLLFIEEMIRSLIESGLLVRDRRSRSWRLQIDINEIRIPSTIHDVIMARVDRLAQEVKDVLRAASVIGQSFLYQVLRTLTDEGERLDDELTDLLRQQFIGERRKEPDLEYVFRHAVIQEVTYGSILRNQRRELHGRIGEILERMFPDRITEMSGVLAYHFSRAEQWDKARGYLIEAADQADRLAADSEALYHYEQAVVAYARSLGEQLDPLSRARMERKLGEAYFRREENNEALRHFEAALAIVASRRRPSAESVGVGMLREIATQARHALGLGRRRTAPDPASSIEDEIEILRMMGWMFFFSDQRRMLFYALKLLNVSEARSYPAGIALGASACVFACDVFGLSRLSRFYLRKSEQAARDSGNPIAISTARLCLAWHETYAGRWGPAVQHFAEAAAIAWDAGDLRSWQSAMWGFSLLSNHRGEFADAWKASTRMLSVADESGDRVGLRWAHIGRGMALARMQRPAEAEVELAAALREGREAPDYQLLPHAAAELALCALQRDRLSDALSILDEASRVVRSLGLRGHHVATLLNAVAEAGLAAAEQAHGRNGRAALRRAGVRCRAALRAARVYRGAAPHALRLRAAHLWLSGRQQEAARAWRESIDAADALGAQYETALGQREWGARNGDRTVLEEGEQLLRRLVAEGAAALQ